MKVALELICGSECQRMVDTYLRLLSTFHTWCHRNTTRIYLQMNLQGRWTPEEQWKDDGPKRTVNGNYKKYTTISTQINLNWSRASKLTTDCSWDVSCARRVLLGTIKWDPFKRPNLVTRYLPKHRCWKVEAQQDILET